MPRVNVRVFFFIFFVLSLGIDAYPLGTPASQELQKLNFRIRLQPFKHYLLDSPKFQGICVYSQDICPQVECFRGGANIFLCVDNSGLIRSVEIVESREDARFVAPSSLARFLRQFLGKDISNSFVLDKNIDAISGATISSSCFVKIINIMSSRIKSILKKESFNSQNSKWFHWQDKFSLFITIFLIALAIFSYLRGGSLLRYISLLLVLLYFGFYKGYFLSINSFANFLETSSSFKVFIFFSLLSVFLWGRFYCGWLCPFGALMGILNRFFPGKVKVPANVNRHLSKLKIFLFLVYVFLFVKYGVVLFLPFSKYAFILSDFYFASLFFILVFVSLLIPYFWCRYICPVGGFLSILSLLSFTKYRFECPRKDCSLCIIRCPTGALADSKKIIQRECLRCLRCRDCRFKK